LARRIIFEQAGLQLSDPLGDSGETVAAALLAVHRSYARAVMPVISRLRGLAHITGGGIPGNLVRILPADCEAVVDARSWTWPALFRFLQEAGRVTTSEMRDVFNLGVGLIAVVRRDDVPAATGQARSEGVPAWVLGEVRRGPRGVRFTE
jgi:phosphoribosylformylglycinamidine cyclo-ligase